MRQVSSQGGDKNEFKPSATMYYPNDQGKLVGVTSASILGEDGEFHQFWPDNVPVKDLTLSNASGKWYSLDMKFRFSQINAAKPIDYVIELVKGNASSTTVVDRQEVYASNIPSGLEWSKTYGGLSASTLYTVRVSAKYVIEQQQVTPEPFTASTTTAKLPVPVIADKNIKVSTNAGQSSASVQINWNPPPNDDASQMVYEFYRTPDDLIIRLTGVTNYQWTGLLMNSRYRWKMRWGSRGSFSEFSDPFVFQTPETTVPSGTTDPAYDKTPSKNEITPLDVWGYSSSFANGNATRRMLAEETGVDVEQIADMPAWSWKDNAVCKRYMGRWDESEAAHGLAPGTKVRDYATFTFYKPEELEPFRKYLKSDSKRAIKRVELLVERGPDRTNTGRVVPLVAVHDIPKAKAGEVSPHDRFVTGHYPAKTASGGLLPNERVWLPLPKEVWKPLIDPPEKFGESTGLCVGHSGHSIKNPGAYPKPWEFASGNPGAEWMDFKTLGTLRVILEDREDAPKTKESKDDKTDNTKIQKLLRLAEQNLGVPYTYTSSPSPQNGWGCEGYVWWLYKQIGIDIGRGTAAQVSKGVAVSSGYDWDLALKKARPGDLIFWNPQNLLPKTPNGHVVLYVGNGMCYGAQNPSRGTVKTSIDGAYTVRSSKIIIRRIVK